MKRIISKDTLQATDTCNAKLHKKDGYCMRPAGTGTSHPGEGRCNLHAGSSTGPRTPPAKVVPSKYSPFFSDEKQKEMYEKILGDKTLDDEIAVCKVQIADILQSLSVWRDMLQEQLRGLADQTNDEEKTRHWKQGLKLSSVLASLQADLRVHLDTVSKIIERDQRVREGAKFLIDVRGLSEFAQKQMLIVNAVCVDCPKRNQLAEKFKGINITSSALPPLATQLVSGGEIQDAEVVEEGVDGKRE